MARHSHSDLAAKLLGDAAAFFKTIAEQNEPLREQMEENASVFDQVAALLRKDPLGKVNEKTYSDLAAKLLKDAAAFFKTIGEQNEDLKDQMDENADVYEQIAGLLAKDPTGEIAEDVEDIDLTVPATAPQPAQSSTAVSSPVPSPVKPHPAKPIAKPEPSTERIDPLSKDILQLNGYQNYHDPVLGLSFPTKVVPDPTTILWNSKLKLGAATVQRENFICRYCGVRSEKYQEAVGRFSAVSSAQAHCACIFCAQVMALDKVTQTRSGLLIYLPELGQAELNAYLKIIYVCRISQGIAADTAKEFLDTLKSRSAQAKDIIGTDDPLEFSMRLAHAASREEYDLALSQAADIRLLPLDRRMITEGDLEFNQFPQILAFWRSKKGPFGGIIPNKMNLDRFRETLLRIQEGSETAVV